MKFSSLHIAVIGLGYVGLPLAVAFAKKYPVTGFDINSNRIQELLDGIDATGELDSATIKQILSIDRPEGLYLSSSVEKLQSANFFIVTVPTPVDSYNKPDLTPLLRASETVGRNLKKGVFERVRHGSNM